MIEKYFTCSNCGKKVNLKTIGTRNRNHCPHCLWSKHVDDRKAGDRLSFCKGLMEPIALTFKDEGIDKYGKKRQGEIMLVHKCQICGRISNNRIAGDDDPKIISSISEEKDKKEVKKQLFGQ